MISCRSFVALSLAVTFLRAVSGCVINCTDKPFFTPSRLVVKHGDSTFGTCHLCPSCQNNYFRLEASVGNTTINGTMISWTVPRMTQWGTAALCYYYNSATAQQCCTRLPVTVYKPPDSVSFSFANHSGQLYEARRYTLQCDVHEVAPARCVSVTFYRGGTPLQRLPSDEEVKTERPESRTYTLNVNASKEDDGVQYWCEATLELGPDGPRQPPTMASQRITANVHYKPQRQEPSPLDQVTVTQGDALQLNCTAEGNPQPSYSWRFLPAGVPLANGSVFTIASAEFDDQGHYSCFASNDAGALTVNFNVVVKANIVPYIAIPLAVVVVVMIAGVVWWYRQSRTGQYDLKDVCCHRKPHTAVPTTA